VRITQKTETVLDIPYWVESADCVIAGSATRLVRGIDLLGVIFNVQALQLDELLKAKLA